MALPFGSVKARTNTGVPCTPPLCASATSSLIMRVVLAAVHAGAERRRVELERVGMLHEALEREVALIGVQLVVHLPIAVLVAGARRRDMRLERCRVQLRDRVVLEDVVDLVGLDVVAIDLRVDLASRTCRSRGTRSPRTRRP